MNTCFTINQKWGENKEERPPGELCYDGCELRGKMEGPQSPEGGEFLSQFSDKTRDGKKSGRPGFDGG